MKLKIKKKIVGLERSVSQTVKTGYARRERMMTRKRVKISRP